MARALPLAATFRNVSVFAEAFPYAYQMTRAFQAITRIARKPHYNGGLKRARAKGGSDKTKPRLRNIW